MSDEPALQEEPEALAGVAETGLMAIPAALANAAGAERLCLFHHAPDHDDAFMDRIEAAAIATRPGTLVAREGMRIDL